MNRVSTSPSNGLSPVRRQAITRTNAGLLSNGFQETNVSEILIGIIYFLFKKMYFWTVVCQNAGPFVQGGGGGGGGMSFIE